MDETNVPDPTAACVTPQLVRNVSCLNCGYSLDGLLNSDVCPECAKPVGDSAHRWALRYADRRHLQFLNAGLSLLILGMVLSCVVLLMFELLILAFPGELTLGQVARVCRTSPMAVSATGAWVFTRIDANARTLFHAEGAARVARLSSIAAVLICVPALPDLLHGLMLPALMHYTHGIALRVPDTVLARWCRVFLWILPVGAVISSAVYLAPQLPDWLDLVVKLLMPTTLLLTCIPLKWLQRHIAAILIADPVPHGV